MRQTTHKDGFHHLTHFVFDPRETVMYSRTGRNMAAISSLHCLCDICAKERRILCMTVQMEVSKLIKIKLIQLKVKSWSPSADKQVSVTNMKHVLKIFMRTEGSDWI